MTKNKGFTILQRDENFIFYMDDGKIIEFETQFNYMVLIFRFNPDKLERFINIKICKN